MTTRVSSLRATALTALALAPTLAAQPAIELTREIYPADSVTSHGEELWQTCRAIDGITGRPIAGAELLLVEERQAPIRGRFWFRHRAVGDADGFVRIRTDDKKDWDWLVLRAPGYGPAMAMNAFEDATVPLAAAQAVPVRVLDVLNRPVAGALIGFCCGCGHTPDLAHATTGADGVAVLRGIDLHNGIRDLYVEHPNLHLGYESFRWFPGDPPAPFSADKGIAIFGVVLDQDGKPAVGVPVGAPDVHRGPWTLTGDDGAFRLCGLESPTWDLFVMLPDHRVLFEHPPEMPYRLQLPKWNGEKTQVVNLVRPPKPPVDETKLLDVELRIETSGFEYTLVGPLPRQDVLKGETRHEFAREVLLPGIYELRLTCGDHRELERRIEVETDAGNLFRLQPEPLPTVVIRVDGLPTGCWVSLGSADGTRDIHEQVKEGLPVSIDDRKPVWFILHGPQSRRRVLQFAPGAALAEPELRLQWYRPTLLRGRLVDADGKLVPARVAVESVGEEVRDFDLRELETMVSTDGRLDVPANSAGLTMLAVIPNDPALAPRLLAMSLPERGDDRVFDLGDVQLSATPRLTFIGADDEAAFLRSGWSELRGRGPFFPVERGRWLGPDPRAGDAILVPGAQNEDATVLDLAFRKVLSGAGPWTVRPPTGQLLVDVRSDTGEVVPARVLLRDQDVGVAGRTLLRRVPPGEHRLFIAAEGHQTAIARIDVKEGEQAVLEVVLPTR